MNSEVFSKYIEDSERYVLGGMVKYAVTKGFPKELAEDALVEGKVKAWNNKDKYDPSKAGFKAWFFRIALNTLIDNIKKAAPEQFAVRLDSYSGEESHIKEWIENRADNVVGADSVYGGIEQQQEYNDALDILEKLPENLRVPMYMLFVEDKSYNEIAEELGIKPEAVRVRVCRAKKMAQNLSQQKNPA
jgi:RNA polymerase sigma-70 factor (ECF subfamily)